MLPDNMDATHAAIDAAKFERNNAMKKLEIIIKPDKLETLKDILETYECGGMTLMSVMGHGKQKGHDSEIKELKVNINLLPKIYVIAVVQDEAVEDLLKEIHELISTNMVGDGKVFISEISDAMRIRTGQRGEDAL
jgi:nitrogen regulatory protein P-II 1